MTSEAHLAFVRASFGNGADPVLVLDAEGRVLYANAGARDRWTEGSTIKEADGFARAVLPVLGSDDVRRVEWGDVGTAGVRCWYACTIAPMRNERGIFAWLCVSTEMTEVKRNEERLRRSETLMVDTYGVAHLGTWEWDVSQPHAHWSAELYRIYGLTPETYTPSYEAYLQMVHPDDRQRVIDATNRVFHEHIPYSHDERIFRPDGTMRHLHTWAYPTLDDEGRLQRLVGVCQDITDRAEAEEKVLRANADLERRVAERTRQLEASVRDLEAFNAMVSHDLRAPLSTIEMASALLARREPGSEDVVKGRERIKRAISQMKILIDDLLAFATIENVALRAGDVDLSALAGEILADLRQAEPQRAVEVVVAPQISCIADRALMRIALQNLLGNAWKYTTRISPARIEVLSTERGGRRVLEVRDNGAGFDMKDANRLFVPFQRLHSEGEFAGTGLGLASVRRIFERHGCRVWAEAAPGAGAAFFVELPDSVETPFAAGPAPPILTSSSV
jgi:PAS domain S-box-containing protein